MRTNDGNAMTYGNLRLVYHDAEDPAASGTWALTGTFFDLEYIGTTSDDAPRDEVATPARALEIARRILPSAVAVYVSVEDDPIGGWVVLTERLPADAGARHWNYAEVAEPGGSST